MQGVDGWQRIAAAKWAYLLVGRWIVGHTKQTIINAGVSPSAVTSITSRPIIRDQVASTLTPPTHVRENVADNPPITGSVSGVAVLLKDE